MRSSIFFRAFEGTAKFRFCPSLIAIVETPTTSPFSFRTGPPLLPGEMGAVICISLLSGRARMPLTSPFEKVPSRNPIGLPTA